jgi:hypothetical protein
MSDSTWTIEWKIRSYVIKNKVTDIEHIMYDFVPDIQIIIKNRIFIDNEQLESEMMTTTTQ